jgi:predicted PhzF superfamily epimerase YddE/YHI9
VETGAPRSALSGALTRQAWTTTHLFWGEDTTTFHARNPFPPGGVVDDPATGAAAAAFGGYLRDLRLVPVPGRVTLHQGHDMGSPSRLLVDLAVGTSSVQVTGSASQLALSAYEELERL